MNSVVIIPASSLANSEVRHALHYIAQAYDYGLKVLEQMECEHLRAVESKDSQEISKAYMRMYNQRKWLKSLDSQRVIDLRK